MKKTFLFILESVMANVTAYYICKWLDLLIYYYLSNYPRLLFTQNSKRNPHERQLTGVSCNHENYLLFIFFYYIYIAFSCQ